MAHLRSTAPLPAWPSAAALAVAASLLLAGCYNDAHDYRALIDSNATAAGQVVYVDCHSHGLVVVSFEAQGHEYRLKAPLGTLDCHSAHRGDPVTVYYDPAHPQVNTMLWPADAYERARGWYVPETFFIVGMPILLLVVGIVGRARADRAGRARGAQGKVK